jgi:hypothetical protein
MPAPVLGLVNTADTSGVLALQTAGTTAVTVDASQNVGIGTSSPATYGNLAVYTAASNTEIAAVTGGANYCTFSLRNNSIRYSMQIRTDQSNAWTLRDETAGANRLLVDTSGNLQFNSGYGSAATAYGCRAWVNFNGTGTVAIRASGNVSSITDNGTGNYTVNFTTAMTDANYAVCGSAFGNVVHSIMSPDGTPSTTAVQVITSNTTAVGDNSVVAVAIFR